MFLKTDLFHWITCFYFILFFKLICTSKIAALLAAQQGEVLELVTYEMGNYVDRDSCRTRWFHLPPLRPTISFEKTN
jgi:hypothetical protein